MFSTTITSEDPQATGRQFGAAACHPNPTPPTKPPAAEPITIRLPRPLTMAEYFTLVRTSPCANAEPFRGRPAGSLIYTKSDRDADGMVTVHLEPAAGRKCRNPARSFDELFA